MCRRLVAFYNIDRDVQDLQNCFASGKGKSEAIVSSHAPCCLPSALAQFLKTKELETLAFHFTIIQKSAQRGEKSKGRSISGTILKNCTLSGKKVLLAKSKGNCKECRNNADLDQIMKVNLEMQRKTLKISTF